MFLTQAARLILSTLLLVLFSVNPVFAQDESKPNIVLVFMDNFGYGELGVYGGGITRGGTNTEDRLACRRGHETDEFQCRGTVHTKPSGDYDRSLCDTNR